MSDLFATWVSVIPPKGQIKEVIRVLLDLAPDPRDVRTVGNGDEFLVPPDLADAYNAVLAPPKKSTPRTRAKKEEGS